MEEQQLLHLGLVVSVGQALQSHHHRPLPQRYQEVLQLWPHVGEEVDEGLEVLVESLELSLVQYWLCRHLLRDGILDRLLQVRLVNLHRSLRLCRREVRLTKSGLETVTVSGTV